MASFSLADRLLQPSRQSVWIHITCIHLAMTDSEASDETVFTSAQRIQQLNEVDRVRNKSA